MRIPPPSAPASRDDGIVREWRIIEALTGTERAPHRGDRRLHRPVGAGPDLLHHGLRRRLVAHVDAATVAGTLRHRPRGAARPGLPARRGHRAARQRRLAGQGPGGPRAARGLPRAPGGPLDRVPGAHQGPRAPRLRRGGGVAAGPPPDRLHPRASCTATTSSPTSCSRTARRRGWPPSSTGRWAPSATPSSTWAGSCSPGPTTPPADEDRTGGYVDMTGMPSRDEVLAHYAKTSGRQVDDIDYYCVLAKWKLAVVLEQGFQRAGDDEKLQAFGAGRARPDAVGGRPGRVDRLLGAGVRITAACAPRLCSTYGGPEVVDRHRYRPPPGSAPARSGSGSTSAPSTSPTCW